MRLLTISGSLREGSYNTALARAAADVAPEGVEVELFDGLGELPHFDADLEGDENPAVRHLRESIDDADAVLFVTPEYNGSIPGVLKNAVDWASRSASNVVMLVASTVPTTLGVSPPVMAPVKPGTRPFTVTSPSLRTSNSRADQEGSIDQVPAGMTVTEDSARMDMDLLLCVRYY